MVMTFDPVRQSAGSAPSVGVQSSRSAATGAETVQGSFVTGDQKSDMRRDLLRATTGEQSAHLRRDIETSLEHEAENQKRRGERAREERERSAHEKEGSILVQSALDLEAAHNTQIKRAAYHLNSISRAPRHDEVIENKSESNGFFGAARDLARGAGKLGWDLLSAVGRGGLAAGKAVADFAVTAVNEPGAAVQQLRAMKDAVGEGVADLWSATVRGYEICAPFIKEHGVSAVKGLFNFVASPVKGCFYLGQTIGEGILDVGDFVLGNKSWSAVSQNFSSNLGLAGSEFAKPIGLLKGLSDGIGLTNLIVGAGHLLAISPQLLIDTGRLVTGQGSLADLRNNFVGHLVGVKDGVVGGLQVFCEVTGLADCALGLKHLGLALMAYGRGDMTGVAIHMAQTVMHGAFVMMSWQAIAATVATGGAACGSILAVATLRQGAKQAAKEFLKEGAQQFFKWAAQETGEVVLAKVSGNAAEVLASRYGSAAVANAVEKHAAEAVGKATTKAAREALASEAVFKELLDREARQGGADVLKEVARRGADAATPEVFSDVGLEIADRSVKALLQELKLDEIVKDEVLPLLKGCIDKDPEKFAGALSEKYGLSQAEAKAMSSAVQKAVKSGKSDTEIAAILEQGIAKPMQDKFVKEMELPFRETVRSGLKGEMPEVFGREMVEAVEKKAAKLGKTVDGYIDELTDAAWKGYREGIERAVRGAVREGILKAIKEFRRVKYRARLHGSGGVARSAEHYEGEPVLHEIDFRAEGERLAKEGELRRGGSEEVYESTYLTTDADGNPIEVRTRVNPADNHLDVSVRKLSTSAQLREKAA